jgi:hypothetical protein
MGGLILSATIPTIEAQLELQPISLLLPCLGGIWRHVPVDPLSSSTLMSKIPERLGVWICLVGSSLDMMSLSFLVKVTRHVEIIFEVSF